MTATPSTDDLTEAVAISTGTLVRVIATGLVLSAVGFALFLRWRGLDELQTASDPTEFAAIAVAHGSDVRWASWADIGLFVPGYVLLLGGILAVFRRRSATPVRVRRASILGTWAAVAGGVADQVENTIVQLGLRAVDLSASDPLNAGRPSDELITALHAATAGKFLFGALALLVVAGLSARAIYGQFVGRSGETP